MTVEQTGFVPRDVELNVFEIELLVPIDSVSIRIVPHLVVPPIEEREGLRKVDRIAVVAARVVEDGPPGDVINLAVPLEGIEHHQKS